MSSRPILLLFALLVQGCGTVAVEPYREVTCFQGAHVSLKDAIRAAEQQGGRALDAAYREPDEMGCVMGDPGYYDVTLWSDGKFTPLSVDADTSHVEPRIEQSFARVLGGQFVELLMEGSPQSRAADVGTLHMTLIDAVAVAEASGGKAMEARIERRDGKAGYAVKLVDANGKLRVSWLPGA
jgi:uncharacterized membrane protein YkoI